MDNKILNILRCRVCFYIHTIHKDWVSISTWHGSKTCCKIPITRNSQHVKEYIKININYE